MKKENEARHSQTPWRQDKGFYCEIEDANGDHIFTASSHYNRALGDEQCRANAEFILECVNAHERMVAENARLREVLKACLNDMRFDLCLYDDIPSRRMRVEADMAEARAALGEEAENESC